ncbi:MAG: hypothetical protein IPL39_15085 [Opitutaceae bacterium]|nr:hypothetical protein [Opitutaceae bacterium]
MTSTVIPDLWRKRLRFADQQGMSDTFCKSQFGHDKAELIEQANAEAEREAVAGSAAAVAEAAKLREAAGIALSKADALAESTAKRQLERDTLVVRIADLRATLPAIEKFIADTLESQSAIAAGLAKTWADPDFAVRQANPQLIATYEANVRRAVEIPFDLAAQRAALVLVRDELKAAEAQLRKIERS